MAAVTPAIVRELRRVLDEASIPDAVALPASAEDARAVVAWCYAHDVVVIPRGGGTGFAGGCVPLDGGVVLSLERLRSVRSFDPLLWRMEVEAGRSTAEVAKLARESGLYFPPDPGAAEQSQIGGNVATNAGGPYAFKYRVTGDWVTGLEAVVARRAARPGRCRSRRTGRRRPSLLRAVAEHEPDDAVVDIRMTPCRHEKAAARCTRDQRPASGYRDPAALNPRRGEGGSRAVLRDGQPRRLPAQGLRMHP
jgi:FAD/FMN-containing dehydrogenase